VRPYRQNTIGSVGSRSDASWSADRKKWASGLRN
jgi:hypothetical protein